MFESLMLTPFCMEKSNARKKAFCCFSGVSVSLLFESGKICKNTDHICLLRCMNTCLAPREMFEHSK